MPSKYRKPDWNALHQQYCCLDFIQTDPILFPHRFSSHTDWRHAECVAFLAALFSYGRREQILKTLDTLFSQLGPEPVTALLQTPVSKLRKQFRDFYYRFNTADDLVFVLARLGEIYQTHESLKAFWTDACRSQPSLPEQIHRFRFAFLREGQILAPETYGMQFLFADPLQNSAAKRFNMFLRWMVRRDAVDLGLWADILSPAELRMPLDTHVAAMARLHQITQRKANDWKTVEEITRYFRKHCPEDPVRYDFALFGLGLEKAKLKAFGSQFTSKSSYELRQKPPKPP